METCQTNIYSTVSYQFLQYARQIVITGFVFVQCELRQDEIKIRILQMCQFCLGMLLINTSHLAVGFSASARRCNVVEHHTTGYNFFSIQHYSDYSLQWQQTEANSIVPCTILSVVGMSFLGSFDCFCSLLFWVFYVQLDVIEYGFLRLSRSRKLRSGTNQL
ncbi:hypothetical protein T09_589 [Trichinella sp. T9]|nr:hypothetical protein T09_589 [Trichinella sp. T9]